MVDVYPESQSFYIGQGSQYISGNILDVKPNKPQIGGTVKYGLWSLGIRLGRPFTGIGMSRWWWLTDCIGSCTGTQGRLSDQMPSVFDLGEMAALLYMDYCS